MRSFAKFAEKQHIDDSTLIEVIQRAELGLIDANLGNGIIKQRIARKGQGKFGGFRTLIFYRLNGNHFFVAGFAKNDQENLSEADLTDLKALAKEFAQYSQEQIAILLETKGLIEVTQHEI